MRIRTAAASLSLVSLFFCPVSAHAQTPETGAARAAANQPASAWGGARVRVGLTAGVQAGAPGFVQQSTLQIYAEDAPIAVAYGQKTGLLVDGSLGVHVKGHFGVGVAVSYSRSKIDGQVHGEIPSPFHFDEPRPIDGTASGLPRVEVGTHIQLLYLWPMSRTFSVMLSAGPSVIAVQQDLVSDVTFSDVYPYDTATYQSARLVRANASGLGFNAGADFMWRVTRVAGLGALVRYTRASVSLPVAGQPAVSSRAGGAQVGIGVRLMF